jgi:DNA repair ATPase RecN
LKAEVAAVKQAKEALTAAAEAQAILQTVAAAVQESAHRQIAAVVGKCLKAVFAGEAYDFSIHFARKRGRTEAHFVFSKGGIELDHPLEEAGGGVCQVAAFALRVAAVVLQQPPRRRLLVLDEAFLGLSELNAAKVGHMLSALAEELNLQIIQVTHRKELMVGHVVNLGE